MQITEVSCEQTLRREQLLAPDLLLWQCLAYSISYTTATGFVCKGCTRHLLVPVVLMLDVQLRVPLVDCLTLSSCMLC